MLGLGKANPLRFAAMTGSGLFKRMCRAAGAGASMLLLASGLGVAAAVIAPSPAMAAGSDFFRPVTPDRASDTRFTAFGALPLLPGEARAARIVGYGGVPADAVAVALNITVTAPTTNGFITVYPADLPRPNVSNLNFVAGQTVANMVTTAVSPDGDIMVYNGSAAATVHVIVDVTGWYSGGFRPVEPTRAVDTRVTAQPLGNGEDRVVMLRGIAGIPANAKGVVINVTTVSPQNSGFLTVYPDGSARPVASNANFIPGLNVANMVTVGLGSSGAIRVYGFGSETDFIIDVSGWFDDGFRPLTPQRIADTRGNSCGGRMGPGETRFIQVAGRGGVPANAGAVAMTVTAVGASTNTFLTIWPTGTTRPNTSNLNTIGGNVPNVVATGLGSDGRVALYNASGTVDVLIDVTGWYDGNGAVLGTTAGCQTEGLAAGVTATHAAPTAISAGMTGSPIRTARYGQSGDHISTIQARLYALGYWVPDFDGAYGGVTSQAVMAFQKWNGRPRTGNLSETDAYLLSMQSYGASGLSTAGDRVEVDKGKQLFFLIRDGKTILTVNTSTGSDIPYTEVNQKTGGPISGDAHTRPGRFKVNRIYSDGWESGQLGELYRPRYFDGGIAVHGAPQIPGYPASHGCVRVTTTFMDWIWHTGSMPVGSEVWVHE